MFVLVQFKLVTVELHGLSPGIIFVFRKRPKRVTRRGSILSLSVC